MSIAYDDIVSRLRFGQPDWLAKALDASGVTSAEMADYLGVSRNTISNYINGRTEPKLQTLRLWAMRTGVPLSFLVSGVLADDSGPNNGGPLSASEKITIGLPAKSNVIPLTFKQELKESA